MQAAAALVHLFLGEKLDLLQAVTIADFSFFTLCGIALFVLRAKLRDAPRPYRAWGYPWLPALFVASSAAVVVSGIFTAQREAVVRAAITIAVGLVLYVVWNRGRATATDRS
jgi:APA family basic amino acid/polyamine antiporter